MYLKKLELLGFKSFADRTEFTFEPGLTAIVGPNGCGKSNVVDAFKWIFGSQSAKGLRGSEMKDVIFNGTLSRKPAGYAEVSVVFDNHDGFLDIDYSEVEVTRRLFRSGESEYLINKQKCRLKDIRELFLDTGIGQTSYSILEQGKIDVLLQSSPEERRMIFEEAAGISRYRVKKAEALRALLRVEDNLNRLQDIIDEVEKQIRRVKTQAAKARKYKEASDRLKELRIRLALEDWHRSTEDRVSLSFDVFWAKHRLARLEDLRERVERGLEARLAERAALQDRLRGLRERASEEASARERVEERLEQARRRIEELRTEHERKEADRKGTVAQVESLRAEVAEGRRRSEALIDDTAKRREHLARTEEELETCRLEHRARDEALRSRKEEVVTCLQSRSRIANRLVQVASELKSLEGRRERLENAIAGFLLELEAASERDAYLESEIARVQSERERIDLERKELETRVHHRADALRELEEELATCREAIYRKSSRFDVLRSFEERLDGVASGVAEILRARDELPEEIGLCGMVGALLKVDRQFAAAVEAALGARTQSLVVESHEGALELLRLVRKRSLGGVEVIALDRVDWVDPVAFPKQGGVLGSLREHVVVEESFEELFDRLLAHVVLIEDLSTAVALARNGLRPYRLVTLAGELVEPWGGFAVAGRTETGIVSRRSEMDALREEVVALEARAIELRTTIESREAERDELVRRRTERESAIAEIDRRLVALEGEHAQVKREIERLRREREVSEAERTEVTREIEVRERERAECQSEETAAAEELARLEGGIRDLEAGLEASARIVEERASAAAIEKLELAQAEKEAEGLVELVGEREANLEMRERLLGDLGREIESLVRRRRETEETIVTASAELETMRVREEETRAALRVEEESDHSLQEVERLFRTEIESIRRSIEAVRSEREDLALREQEGRHTRNTILERIDEQYGIDLSALVRAKENRAKEAENALAETPALDAAIASEPIPELATEPEVEEASLEDRLVEEAAPSGNGTSAPDVAHAVESTQEGTTAETASDEESARESAPALIEPERRTEDLLARYLEPDPDWDRDRAREEIRELQDQLRKLGSVNLEAIDEIEELESRYEFQRAQKEDLDQSQRQLRALIDDINRKSREMFAETFARVQENFRELFRKSFGGGRAELELESGVDMLDAGIEIVARPPGKKLTSLSLMSGGEKTMTTIALLLAIFRSRPSPFCVLDEVDAPLDEANVQRFIVLLKEFVGQSQFIIITHNKRTMAEGETLYGVTMEERGVSKRVSVELESYDPERMELAASGRDAE